MKIFVPPSQINTIDALEALGYDVTVGPDEATHIGFLQPTHPQTIPMMAATNLNNIVNINLTTKAGLYSALVEAGVPVLTFKSGASLSNIQSFGDNAFIIKPTAGYASFDKNFNFTYKPFTNYSNFVSSVDMDDFNDRFISTGEFENYTVQQALVGSDGIIRQFTVHGFVDPNSNIWYEPIGLSEQVFTSLPDQHRAEVGVDADQASDYKYNFDRYKSLASPDVDFLDYNFISDIQQLFNHFNVKSVPFNCQAIIDPYDTNKCYITDFAYKIRPRNVADTRREYLLDKLKFMYEGTSVELEYGLYTSYITLTTPNGKNKALIDFCAVNDITYDMFAVDTIKHLPFSVVGTTQAELDTKVQLLKDFLLSDY